MATHPVGFRFEPTVGMERLHVVIRLALLVALGAIGCSSLYWVLYLALPALAALVISQKGGARYLSEDGPTLNRALGWLAGAYAYLWLLTDQFPTTRSGATVKLEIQPVGEPAAPSALLRLIYSIPALALLAILSCVAGLLWVVGAMAILIARRVPASIAGFLALTLAYQFRLIAYHLSLVDRYPSLEPAAIEPHAAAA
jgi:hypothetical protein